MKNFNLLVVIRVLLLTGTIFLLAFIFGDMRLIFNQIVLAIIIIAQTIELMYFLHHSNRELSRFLNAIKHEDFSISFQKRKLGRSFNQLDETFNSIIKSYKDISTAHEIQYQFLQQLVRQLQVGLLVVQHDTITLINTTAETLTGLEGVKNWKLAEQLNPLFTNAVLDMQDQGHTLLEFNRKNATQTISVDVSTLTISDKAHTIIILQDINAAIEAKELEAYHKLIRILTHEIMNSVTPISSLTETLYGMLSDKDGSQKPLDRLTNEMISDIRFSLTTISKRSDGLLDFVESYRKLSKVPKPVLQSIEVYPFLLSIQTLMKATVSNQNISLTINVSDKTLAIKADPVLLEQVIINLISNSIYAMDESTLKEIQLLAYAQDNAVFLAVQDTGKGIDENVLKEIFIPFFSTRKNGSGIGLSLCKQIMSLHRGTIHVQTKPGQGTVMTLRFVGGG